MTTYLYNIARVYPFVCVVVGGCLYFLLMMMPCWKVWSLQSQRDVVSLKETAADQRMTSSLFCDMYAQTRPHFISNNSVMNVVVLYVDTRTFAKEKVSLE